MSSLNRTGRGRLSGLIASCALVVALAFPVGSGLADTNCGAPNALKDSCFAAGDADQLDGPGDLIDWQSIADAPATVDLERGIDSKFKGGSKELEPGAWELITGNNTPKTD